MTATITPINTARVRGMRAHPAQGSKKPAPYSLQTGGAGFGVHTDLRGVHNEQGVSHVRSNQPTSPAEVAGAAGGAGELEQVNAAYSRAVFDRLEAAPGSVEHEQAARLVRLLGRRRAALVAAGNGSPAVTHSSAEVEPGAAAGVVLAHLWCAALVGSQALTERLLVAAKTVRVSLAPADPVQTIRLMVAIEQLKASNSTARVSRTQVSKPAPRPVPRRRVAEAPRSLHKVSALHPFAAVNGGESA